MPSKFENKDQLLQHLKNDMDIQDKQKREQVADIVMQEAQADEGNPEKLLTSIKNGAKNILSNLGLETVSWVENPSQDSMFVMMKNADSNIIRKDSQIYKEPEEDWSTVYGPVMRPNDIDKDGDIAPAHDIRKAAHEFMAEGRVKQFDQDHDLNTGKGTLVESWILKEDTDYELPDGSTETIEAGSWMVGVQPNQEVKQRIEQGEITGWSIFGQADKVELSAQPAFKNFNKNSANNSFKENDTMSENPDNQEQKEQDDTLKQVHEAVKSLQEDFNEYKDVPEPSTVKSMEDLKKHLKSDNDSNLIEIGKDFELETTEKEPDMEDMSELMEYLEDSLSEDNFSMLVDAVRGDTVEEEMDEDEDEDEEKQDTEKSENPKNKSKQVDTNIEKDSGKISFQRRAEQYREEA